VEEEELRGEAEHHPEALGALHGQEDLPLPGPDADPEDPAEVLPPGFKEEGVHLGPLPP